MASLGDPGIQGAYLGVGKPKTQERARGPTHTRRIPYRMEIPAPSSYRARGISWAYVVEGHASACPRTGGVDASRGALTLEMSCGMLSFKVSKKRSFCRVTEGKKKFSATNGNHLQSLLCCGRYRP